MTARWMTCGVNLEREKEPSLRGEIVALPAPGGLPAPRTFAPLRKKKPGRARILGAAEEAGIVDELDGEPLARKLSRYAARKTRVLAAVCFDDDPLATGEQAVLRENTAQVLAGLELAAAACGAAERKIAAASRREVRRMRGACPGVGFWAAGDRYPALAVLRLRHGAERAGTIGAQACAALAEAAKGRAQCETVVTVAGDGVSRWMNCRVRLGTPVGSVLQAGVPDENPAVVAVESAVNGRAVTDLSEPVGVLTRCVLAFRKLPRRRALPCVGCGRCARACPRGIVPWMILRQLESGAPDPVFLLGVERCIRCGACGAACPSGIGLAAVVARAEAVKEGGAAPCR